MREPNLLSQSAGAPLRGLGVFAWSLAIEETSNWAVPLQAPRQQVTPNPLKGART